MTVVRYEPWGLLNRLRRELDQTIESAAHDASWCPAVDIHEEARQFVVRADLPGLTPDDVQIDVEADVLTVSGERRQRHEERQEGFYRSERSYGAFSRSIPLPDGVDPGQVQASFEHGVLEVTVPIPPQRQRGRRVQIRAGGAQPNQPKPK